MCNLRHLGQVASPANGGFPTARRTGLRQPSRNEKSDRAGLTGPLGLFLRERNLMQSGYRGAAAVG